MEGGFEFGQPSNAYRGFSLKPKQNSKRAVPSGSTLFAQVSVLFFMPGHSGEGGGNLGVILVRVCEQVFQNLPHSYTWPSKQRTHSYT